MTHFILHKCSYMAHPWRNSVSRTALFYFLPRECVQFKSPKETKKNRVLSQIVVLFSNVALYTARLHFFLLILTKKKIPIVQIQRQREKKISPIKFLWSSNTWNTI